MFFDSIDQRDPSNERIALVRGINFLIQKVVNELTAEIFKSKLIYTSTYEYTLQKHLKRVCHISKQPDMDANSDGCISIEEFIDYLGGVIYVTKLCRSLKSSVLSFRTISYGAIIPCALSAIFTYFCVRKYRLISQ